MAGAMQNAKTGMKPITAALLALIGATFLAAAAASQNLYPVRDFGAKGDGQADDTVAFQKTLDAAKEAGGGVVYAPRGNYFFAGHLTVPPAVTLRGVWESVPSNVGLRNRGAAKPTDDGTTFLVTENQDKEEGTGFITLRDNSTLKGVVLYYPNQNPSEEPKPYPYSIARRGKNPAVLAVELLNPYNGIDAAHHERHLIRDVSGQPLRRGTVGFSDCTFVQWDQKREGGHAIQAQSGKILVSGCEFREDKPQIELGEGVRQAAVSDNIFSGKPRVTNRSKIPVTLNSNICEP